MAYRHERAFRAFRSSLCVIAACVNLGMDGCGDRIRIRPEVAGTKATVAEELGGGPWCSPPSAGLATLRPLYGDDDVVAGYTNTFSDGTDPFPCPYYRGNAIIGVARFNLSEYPFPDLFASTRLRRAVLFIEKIDHLTHRSRFPGRVLVVGVAEQAWGEGYEVRDVERSAGPLAIPLRWRHFEEGGVVRPALLTTVDTESEFSIEVTETVQEWADGTLPNHGFVIAPQYNDVFQDNNRQIVGRFFFLELQLQFE